MSAGFTSCGNCQSIGLSPNLIKASLHLENGREPKKPRSAEKGLGWGDLIITFFPSSIKGILFCANFRYIIYKLLILYIL